MNPLEILRSSKVNKVENGIMYLENGSKLRADEKFVFKKDGRVVSLFGIFLQAYLLWTLLSFGSFCSSSSDFFFFQRDFSHYSYLFLLLFTIFFSSHFTETNQIYTHIHWLNISLFLLSAFIFHLPNKKFFFSYSSTPPSFTITQTKIFLHRTECVLRLSELHRVQ